MELAADAEMMSTCKGQGFGVVELPRLHGLLLFLQSCQHVSKVQLHGALALLPCRLSEGLLSDPEGRRQGCDHTDDPQRNERERKKITSTCAAFKFTPAISFVPC